MVRWMHHRFQFDTTYETRRNHEVHPIWLPALSKKQKTQGQHNNEYKRNKEKKTNN